MRTQSKVLGVKTLAYLLGGKIKPITSCELVILRNPFIQGLLGNESKTATVQVVRELK